MYEISDINSMIESILLNKVKIKITIDDNRLKSKLATNKTIMFTRKSLFYTILGHTQSNSGPLGDMKIFVQLIPGSYTGDKPINITGIDEIHLEANCFQGSKVNGVREPILYSFALDKPPGHEMFKEPRMKVFWKDK